MSVLKAIGKGILTGLRVVIPFLPVARALSGANPVASTVFNVFDGIINTTRVMEVAIPAAKAGATGADKAAGALPIVKQIILASELVRGSEIANEDEFVGACQDFINAGVRLQNSLKDK